MSRLTRLHNDHAVSFASADKTSRSAQQNKGVFGRIDARTQQLLIEIQKHHHIGCMRAMQNSFSADQHVIGRKLARISRYLTNRAASKYLQFLTNLRDTNAQLLEA